MNITKSLTKVQIKKLPQAEFRFGKNLIKQAKIMTSSWVSVTIIAITDLTPLNSEEKPYSQIAASPPK